MIDHIYLASASPRRRQILSQLGLSYTVRPVAVDESRLGAEDPAEYVLRLARAKAQASAAGLSSGLVLGADTIVVLDGAVVGKPADAIEARSSLDRLRGREHLVATGVAIVDAATGQLVDGVEWTRVILRSFSDAERDEYIASGDPFDKAGGYAIQHSRFRPVDRIVGSETNVVGLPVELVARLLERLRRTT